MSVQMVRFSTDAERVHEVEDAIAALFTAVSAAAPMGMTYTAGRVGDGPDFVFLLQLAEGVDNPLLGIPDALEFRGRVAGWATEPVAPQPFTVLGRYAG
ncbi:Uncharacterised protein [Mycolicibacterium phlei]|uniref:hypothetical protein n=1 Tax=Mycobacteroides chelonae TaxID=1774 RepID=UPI0006189E98|nr:hypothetical protein [Mycobacteroides chelonae]VEG20592.1 Uncharacterised protein [Mycolicibacterium phlei]AKC41732.1 hypothetical protein GR01_23090 [Mycobacteroides chelonae]ANB00630.1 hypothetical protein BB28_24080 [Mycobacteroides chelonae CCUG 47445]OLT82963.1 hypothetical protein BKG56_05690 [Mycobacteroides chelonae]ORV14510.1 hypothetical protein AWB96_14195 [Mycobacteroides chelonae]